MRRSICPTIDMPHPHCPGSPDDHAFVAAVCFAAFLAIHICARTVRACVIGPAYARLRIRHCTHRLLSLLHHRGKIRRRRQDGTVRRCTRIDVHDVDATLVTIMPDRRECPHRLYLTSSFCRVTECRRSFLYCLAYIANVHHVRAACTRCHDVKVSEAQTLNFASFDFVHILDIPLPYAALVVDPPLRSVGFGCVKCFNPPPTPPTHTHPFLLPLSPPSPPPPSTAPPHTTPAHPGPGHGARMGRGWLGGRGGGGRAVSFCLLYKPIDGGHFPRILASFVLNKKQIKHMENKNI